MRQNLELLAPAGSLETCKAVIRAGADAVYLGGSRFGARAYAENFTQEELLEAIEYAHLYGKQVHLTVNTLFKRSEFEQLYDYLLPYYECGLDAVLVQDYGVLRFLHELFPKLAIHVSTQMSVAGSYGARYLQERGASRVVLARELALWEIAQIHKDVPGVELECFIHGALCYCYSGQCLMSSMLGGRSGNRGRCAQPCRLPYTVLDESHRQISKKDCYPLSMKDLCGLNELPALAEAGVCSFKIEGRMKSTAYATEVVSVYRDCMDRFLSGEDSFPDPVQMQMLLDAGNRSGFTNGYYRQHNGQDMITMSQSSHNKRGDASFHAEKEPDKLPLHGKAYFKVGEPVTLTLHLGGVKGFAKGEIAQPARHQPLAPELLREQLSKTGNTPFQIEQLDITLEGKVFLSKQQINQLRRDAIADLERQLRKPHRRIANYSREAAVQILAQRKRQVSYENRERDSISISALVESSGQLMAVCEQSFIDRVYLSSVMYTNKQFEDGLLRDVQAIHSAGKQAYLCLPTVFRENSASFYAKHWENLEGTEIDGFLVRNYEELGFLSQHEVNPGKCVLDHNLYCWSDYTQGSFASDGWVYNTVPLELHRKELQDRDNRSSELIIYGCLPLMTTAQCLKKTVKECDKKPTVCYLKDRYGEVFPVKNNCNACYNTIYNTRPQSLIQLFDELKELQVAGYRLQFSVEDRAQTARVLKSCRQACIDGERPDIAALCGAYTNGHYKRGVE